MYVDTSVLAAVYLPEAKSNKVEHFLRRQNELTISHLTQVEIASALSRRVRMKEISTQDAQRIFSMFELHLSNGVYRMLPIWQREYVLAQQWCASFQTKLRTLDAIHLAVSFCNEESLVTSDEDLGDAAHALGVNTTVL